MHPVLRNVLAMIAGVLAGGLVNMAIVMAGPMVIPLPEGVDPSDVDSLKENIHLLKARHFIAPFLAHAIGTLAGAFIAAAIAHSHHFKFALGIGAFFLAGGIMNSFLLPAPGWFIAADLLLAYIPFALLGGRFAVKRT